jgi:protein arginine N-methyltransferase 5
MSAVNILSGEGGGVAGRCGERVQQCWQFEHPRRDLILDPSGSSTQVQGKSANVQVHR